MDSILLRKRKPNARKPFRTYTTDAGLDLVCINNIILWPFQVKDLDTGWDIKIPDGFWGSIKTRSSTFYRRKLLILEGVIDPNYTGPLSVVVFNPTFIPKIIRAGDRLGQLLLCSVGYPVIKEVDSLPITDRGTKGFGHTDFI